jgi:hypothetical protein
MTIVEILRRAAAQARQRAKRAATMRGDPNEIALAEGIAQGWDEALAFIAAKRKR